MALYITSNGKHVTHAIAGWHTGQRLPDLSKAGRVLTFQADGDELECILEALRKTRGNVADNDPTMPVETPEDRLDKRIDELTLRVEYLENWKRG